MKLKYNGNKVKTCFCFLKGEQYVVCKDYDNKVEYIVDELGQEMELNNNNIKWFEVIE